MKVGAGENDPKTLKEAQDSFSRSELTEDGAGFVGAEVLYEFDLKDEANKLGVKLGVDVFGQNKLEFYSPTYGKATETTLALPLTVYYKRDNGVKGWSPFVGAGVSFFRTQIKEDDTKDHKSKVVPHIAAGAEYRFTNLFALGFEAKYTFNAKLEKKGVVYSDHTGFSGAITGRFYF